MHSRAPAAAGAVAVLLTVALLTSLLPVNAATVDYGNFGTHPSVGDKDFIIPLEDMPSSELPFLAREEAGNAGVESDDHFYIHFDAATAGTSKAMDDVRLVVASGGTGAAGDLLTSAQATGSYTEIVDLDASATAGDAGDRIDGFIHYLEMDGKPGFSSADWLYIDADDDDDLSAGDIRLSTPSVSGTSASGVSVTATDDYVQTTDDDYIEANDATEDNLPRTVDFETGTTFSIKYFDADTDGQFDSGDTLVIVPDDAPTEDYLGLGMVFLSKAGSRTHGAHVGSSVTGTRPLLDALAATDAYLVTTSNSGDAWLYDLYIHFGSLDGEPSGTPACEGGAVASAASGDLGYIQHGDIILRKGATGTAGAAASYMTRVTSESTGAGVEIKGCAPLAENIYYLNDPDTPSGFTSDDFLYLNIPSTGLGGTDDDNDGLDINDLRLATVSFSSTYSAGTTIRTGDQDLTSLAGETVNPGSHSTAWNLLHRDADLSRAVQLTALTNAKFVDSTSDDLWDPATEEVYISSNGTVWDGDIRIHAGDSGLTGSTTATHTAVSCPGDADCATAVEANTDIKVTGPDGTWDVDQGEFVVWSPDAWATPGHDRAVVTIGAVTAGNTLTTATATTMGWVSSGDAYYLQWDEAADPDGALNILKVHDVKLASTPTFVSATDSDHVPTLTLFPTADHALLRYDAGSDNAASDIYYLQATSTGNDLSANDLRLTAAELSTGGHAGKLLASANTVELGATAIAASATEFNATVRYADIGSSGFDVDDPIYLDLPADIGGNNFGTLSSFDVRLTTVTYGGENHKPGSFVRVGDEDRSDLSFASFAGSTGYAVYYFDENRDGDFNSDDMIYLVHIDDVTSAPDTAVPGLLALRMIGDGGAQSTTSTGGGGTTTSTTTSSTTTSTTTSSTTTTSTTTTTTGDEPVTAEAKVTLANADLASSLQVRRVDGDNILSWDAQAGASGYQVWVSTSPYSIVTNITDGSTDRFVHEDGPAEATYLVTAWVDEGGESVGRLVDVNNALVRGNEDRTGAAVTDGGNGDGNGNGTGNGTGEPEEPVPGLGFLAVAGLLGGVLIAVRRRL